jgi:hypothetical protein
MKVKLFALFFILGTFILQAQQPYVATATLIPPNPTSTSILKLVSKITTANQSIIVDQNFLTVAGSAIKTRACYWQGMAPATQTYIDTLVIGQLPVGNYQIIQKAYLSGAQQHCTNPIDSNSAISTFSVNAPSTTDIREKILNKKVNIYPNPSSGGVFINGVSGAAEVSVFSINGILMMKALINNKPLELHNLPNGLYLILISDKDKIYTEKFIKNEEGR